METGLFIALLNPAIALVLASAFLALWLYQRSAPHLLILAAGFAASAVGFLLQYFSVPFAGFVVTKLGSSLAFTIAVVCLTVAILFRYGDKVPYVPIAILATGGMAGFSWFLLVQSDITWRIYSLNFAFGGLCLLIAAELRPVRRNGPIQKALLALTLLAAVNFLLRTLVAVILHGRFNSYDGFYTSAYWTTTQLAHAMFSLLIALSLLTAAALDMLGKLKAESYTDPLSGLLNRRGFEMRAQALLDRAARTNLPVALVLADLDHFKVVNDRYGHATGDLVIVDFASRLRQAAGARGAAGRIGGEEFAVLLPLTDLGAAVRRSGPHLVLRRGRQLPDPGHEADRQFRRRRPQRRRAARPADGKGRRSPLQGQAERPRQRTHLLPAVPLVLSLPHRWDRLRRRPGRPAEYGLFRHRIQHPGLYEAKKGGRDCVRVAASSGKHAQTPAGPTSLRLNDRG